MIGFVWSSESILTVVYILPSGVLLLVDSWFVWECPFFHLTYLSFLYSCVPFVFTNRFYASWCKSCQKFGVLYKRLALQKGDIVDTSRSSSSSTSGNGSGDDEVLLKYGDVRFAEVEFSANAELCCTLGIKKLPNVHLYKGDLGRITGFPCGPSKFSLLEETLERFLTMTEDELKLEKTLEEGVN
jgi:thiol-disulfide isomerase/thioredoxin